MFAKSVALCLCVSTFVASSAPYDVKLNPETPQSGEALEVTIHDPAPVPILVELRIDGVLIDAKVVTTSPGTVTFQIPDGTIGANYQVKCLSDEAEQIYSGVIQ